MGAGHILHRGWLPLPQASPQPSLLHCCCCCCCRCCLVFEVCLTASEPAQHRCIVPLRGAACCARAALSPDPGHSSPHLHPLQPRRHRLLSHPRPFRPHHRAHVLLGRRSGPARLLTSLRALPRALLPSTRRSSRRGSGVGAAPGITIAGRGADLCPAPASARPPCRPHLLLPHHCTHTAPRHAHPARPPSSSGA